jgi:uncharacterized membrane protein
MAKSVESGNGKAIAVLSYILVGIIWYFIDEKAKNNSFAKFHVKQALVLFIFSIVIDIVGSIIPFLGKFIILPLGNLLVLVLWIFGIVYSLNGQEKELPIIGKFAENFKF